MMNSATAIQTPWGQSQGVDVIAPGIEFVSTASHGGIRLSKQRNNQIPMWLKHLTFNEQGKSGWYEEDCDWCIPVIVFAREAGRWARNQGRHDFLDEAYRVFNTYHLPKVKSFSTGDKPDDAGIYLGLHKGNQAVPYEMDSQGRQGPLIGPLLSFELMDSGGLRLTFKDSLEALRFGMNIDRPTLKANEGCLQYQSVTYAEWFFRLVDCR